MREAERETEEAEDIVRRESRNCRRRVERARSRRRRRRRRVSVWSRRNVTLCCLIAQLRQMTNYARQNNVPGLQSKITAFSNDLSRIKR